MAQSHPPVDRVRPSLLLVTAWTPHPLATGPRRAAWELLEDAAGHYRVDLACLSDTHVSLDQWRALASLADRVMLAPTRVPARVCQGLCVSGAGPWAMQRWHAAAVSLQSELRANILPRYDVLWCTQPLLMEAVSHIEARRRVLDLRTSWCVNNHRLSRRQRGLRRLLTRQAALIHDRLEQRAAGHCDLLITADRRTAHRLKHRTRVVVCPGGLTALIRRDVAHRRATAAQTVEPTTLVAHAA
jgi:hypothetical protein